REACSLDPEPSLLQDLAVVLKASGEKEEAVGVLREAVAGEGPLGPAAAFLGELLLECGRNGEVLELASSGLERSADSRFAAILRLKALASLGREPEVAREMERLATQHRADGEWATDLLGVLERLDDPRAALSAFERGFAPPPSGSEERLARVLARAGGRAIAEGD